MRRLAARSVVLACGLVLLVACSPASPPDGAAPVVGPAPADAGDGATVGPSAALPAGTLEAVAFEIGASVDADGRVAAVQERFRPRDTVHAGLVTVGEAPAAMLRVQWREASGAIVASDERAISSSGPAVHRFSRSVEGGWPAGRYEVEVLMDGRSVGVRPFEVR